MNLRDYAFLMVLVALIMASIYVHAEQGTAYGLLIAALAILVIDYVRNLRTY